MSNPPASTPSKQQPQQSNNFAVREIPAFKGTAKGPVNYAAAAGSKSKPSPAAINGKDATATVIGSAAGTGPAVQAIAAVGQNSAKPAGIKESSSTPAAESAAAPAGG